jgi:dTMP kinase
MIGSKGKFIVLEGTDGSGKTEQFNRLLLRIPSDYKIAMLDFPRYDKESAYFVRKYLTGRYGLFKDIGPKEASLFYALDRFDASFELREWLEQGKIVISNRYVGSNMGHQGSKMESEKERRELFKWLYELEYETFAIPKPNLSIVLHVPSEIAYKLIAKKSAREYLGGAKRDIHEASPEHLKKTEAAYLEMVKLFPDDFVLVECAPGEKLLSIEEIHEKIWGIVKTVIGA